VSTLGKVSLLEELFAEHLKKRCPTPERQYKCVIGRRYAFDFAWPEFMVAVEIQGGQWVEGRHNRPEGYEEDCTKSNLATLAGWRVYRFTGRQVSIGEAKDFIEKALGVVP
jgi:very-short-patch-repair endonuclease